MKYQPWIIQRQCSLLSKENGEAQEYQELKSILLLFIYLCIYLFRYVVNFFLIVTQFRFCFVYLVFVGQSVQEITKL